MVIDIIFRQSNNRPFVSIQPMILVGIFLFLFLIAMPVFTIGLDSEPIGRKCKINQPTGNFVLPKVVHSPFIKFIYKFLLYASWPIILSKKIGSRSPLAFSGTIFEFVKFAMLHPYNFSAPLASHLFTRPKRMIRACYSSFCLMLTIARAKFCWLLFETARADTKLLSANFANYLYQLSFIPRNLPNMSQSQFSTMFLCSWRSFHSKKSMLSSTKSTTEFAPPAFNSSRGSYKFFTALLTTHNNFRHNKILPIQDGRYGFRWGRPVIGDWLFRTVDQTAPIPGGIIS